MRDVLILGAGGLGREVLSATRAGAGPDRPWRVVGFLDDDPGKAGQELDGVPVLGPSDLVHAHPDAAVVVCVGRVGANRTREKVLARLGLDDDRFATVVHPCAHLAEGTDLGPGSIVLAGVISTTPVRIGRHVTLMPAVVLTHDDEVDDFAVFASGVRVAGGVRVGRGAYLGAGALIRENLTIGSYATIGMGAVVLRDVPDGQTWVGVPAAPLGREPG